MSSARSSPTCLWTWPSARASCAPGQTIDIALHGRQIPVLIEPGFDELQAGDLDGAPIQAYRSWKHLHAPDSRFPHGESPADALRRHANALRRLLARTETVTLVVIHQFALRHIAMAAAAGGSRLPDMAVANAVPYLFDERAAQRAAASLDAMVRPGSLGNSPGDTDCLTSSASGSG